jgi:hypothetical protein
MVRFHTPAQTLQDVISFLHFQPSIARMRLTYVPRRCDPDIVDGTLIRRNGPLLPFTTTAQRCGRVIASIRPPRSILPAKISMCGHIEL